MEGMKGFAEVSNNSRRGSNKSEGIKQFAEGVK